MSSKAVLKSLGYDQSPNFIDRVEVGKPSSSRFSHVYRKAVEDCGLHGVYVLNDHQRNVDVPVVFYCKARSEAESSLIHKRIWNQDVTPFVLVETPKMLRLYCGFRFSRHAGDERSRGILEASIAFNEVADRLSSLSANAIDNGRVWEIWGDEVTPRTRVDWTLLANLRELERELRSQGLTRDLAHALIGKFVYLRYLRDRKILSDRKLSKWGIDPADVFSRKAKLRSFGDVNRCLDDWLNGAIFPLETNAIRSSHLQLVAGVFSGDSPQGQLHLDFQPYDFSFIPIETLSVIYEQFLHSPEKGKLSRGRKAGAYYTPLPLVNYMLNELEMRHPLLEGMRVLDPSCGSGAFLVQCYRALIEKRLWNGPLRPAELRELLVRHVYGLDRDGDACQVAEMSLILTLLDYTTPPDLENNPRFKLPILRGSNIFQADYFAPDSEWAHASHNLSFDWLVGNPPWKEFRANDEEDRHVRDWVAQHTDSYPIGGNQIAEAFVWRSLPLLKNDAVAGLVLPAMTLFKKESTRFRQQLFKTVRAWCVANFSNLAYVLFSGRSEHPAMALFFSLGAKPEVADDDHARILTFSPFIMNQRANRSTRKGAKRDTWSIVVNGSELTEIKISEAATGNMQPWKLAMWGTFRDDKLLRKIAKRFPPLTDYLAACNLTPPHEGFELRDATKSSEPIEPMPELAGKIRINFSKLKKCGRIFAFPKAAISSIPASDANVRKGRGKLPMLVSQPPHIIVDASRRFAIYSDKFISVSPRQIGIAGPPHAKNILKALSVYLSSDFVTYQQFFATPQWGISTSQAILDTLKHLPVPLDNLSEAEIREWADLRDALANEGIDGKAVSQKLLDEVNQSVIKLIGLGKSERILIEDFVRWNMQIIKGKVPRIVTKPPDRKTISGYLKTLKVELDIFLGDNLGIRHTVDALCDEFSAIVAIAVTTGADTAPSVFRADDKAAASLAKTREHLLKQHSQWLYFARDLRVYADNTVYMLKPLEQIQWTSRQAILDAGEVIAETLGQQNT
ncbi:MAG: SAM-dependent methyltransferase [Desulfobacterales bacterium]|nr:SAM-dependent methyltransferase [Desulfobacterales bacterium]